MPSVYDPIPATHETLRDWSLQLQQFENKLGPQLQKLNDTMTSTADEPETSMAAAVKVAESMKKEMRA